MVLTLELPIRPITIDLCASYESRFGALPGWLDEIPPSEAPALLRQALRRGAPLVPADYLS
ncbi:hypothetical protein [Dechloromonas denitrificans]|uniref:hypothetical protein n=1 Tax=Dechloromonas denitrificans TaxID=281362 RepID=UPI001CFAA10E|nr:hypothetical protein [Dechloromonas denitrificans]UCV05945.1 hypothetical protein KI615_10850 [Dechloromonas denitrificans]